MNEFISLSFSRHLGSVSVWKAFFMLVGLIGIKVWICRGEVYGKKDLAPNFTAAKDANRGGNAAGVGKQQGFKKKKNNSRI